MPNNFMYGGMAENEDPKKLIEREMIMRAMGGSLPNVGGVSGGAGAAVAGNYSGSNPPFAGMGTPKMPMRNRVPMLNDNFMKGGTGQMPNQSPNKQGQMQERGLPGLQNPKNPGGAPMPMQKPAKQGDEMSNPSQVGGRMNFKQGFTR